MACFASHLHRIQQVLDAASAQQRKVVLLGRSMLKNVELGRRLGVLHADSTAFVDAAALDRLAPHEVLVLCTGSQGEPLSALSRMASGDMKYLDLGPDDTVVLSSHPIPGNEFSVGRVIDDLHRRGAEVLHCAHERVHVSGHARQGELRTFLQLTKPRSFVPVHGEYRHLVHHAAIARVMGVPDDGVLLVRGRRLAPARRRAACAVGPTCPRGSTTSTATPATSTSGRSRTGACSRARASCSSPPASTSTRARIVAWPTVSTRGWFDGEHESALRTRCAEIVAKAVEDALKAGERDADALNRVAEARRRQVPRPVVATQARRAVRRGRDLSDGLVGLAVVLVCHRPRASRAWRRSAPSPRRPRRAPRRRAR